LDDPRLGVATCSAHETSLWPGPKFTPGIFPTRKARPRNQITHQGLPTRASTGCKNRSRFPPNAGDQGALRTRPSGAAMPPSSRLLHDRKSDKFQAVK